MSTTVQRLAVPTFEVLVVDDDTATMAAFTGPVDQLALVRHVPDAYQALYDLKTYRIDAVVTELFLPGASGMDLLRRMRANGVLVPTIVLSQSNGSHPELDALGVRHVLRKPASPELLLATLTDLLMPPAKAERNARVDRTAA